MKSCDGHWKRSANQHKFYRLFMWWWKAIAKLNENLSFCENWFKLPKKIEEHCTEKKKHDFEHTKALWNSDHRGTRQNMCMKPTMVATKYLIKNLTQSTEWHHRSSARIKEEFLVFAILCIAVKGLHGPIFPGPPRPEVKKEFGPARLERGIKISDRTCPDP